MRDSVQALLYTEDREGLLGMVTFDLTSKRCKSTHSCRDLGKEHCRQREQHMQSLKVGTSLFSEEEKKVGSSLAVQWLILCASNTGGVGSIPGRGTNTPHAAWPNK